MADETDRIDDAAEATAPAPVRSYLVVVDDTAESRLALRYAALRAAKVGANVSLLYVIPPTDFVQWGGVQDMIEAEAREKAEALLASVADQVVEWTGIRPSAAVREGDPKEEVMEAISTDATVHALVLGAAPKGTPGPLVSFFSGEMAGQLPCLVMIVPGGLSEAAVERLAC